MPKIIPVPDEVSKPFWDAVNEKRLLLQNCTVCDRLQYPPRQTCLSCGSAEKLEWKDAKGRGHVSTYIVIEDGRLNRRMPDQPYNLALITLDQDPSINFYSNLPGVPPLLGVVKAASAVSARTVTCRGPADPRSCSILSVYMAVRVRPLPRLPPLELKGCGPSTLMSSA